MMQFIAQLFKQLSPGISNGSGIETTVSNPGSTEDKAGLFSENLSHFLKVETENRQKTGLNTTEDQNTSGKTTGTQLANGLLTTSFLPEQISKPSEIIEQQSSSTKANTVNEPGTGKEQMLLQNPVEVPSAQNFTNLEPVSPQEIKNIDFVGAKNSFLQGTNTQTDNSVLAQNIVKAPKDDTAKTGALRILKQEQTNGRPQAGGQSIHSSESVKTGKLSLQTNTLQYTVGPEKIDQTSSMKTGKYVKSPENYLKAESGLKQQALTSLRQDEVSRPVKGAQKQPILQPSSVSSGKEVQSVQANTTLSTAKEQPVMPPDSSNKANINKASPVAKDVLSGNKQNNSTTKYSVIDAEKQPRVDAKNPMQNTGTKSQFNSGNGENKPNSQFKSIGINDVKKPKGDYFLNGQFKADTVEKELAEVTQRAEGRIHVNQYLKNELPDRLAKILKQHNFSNSAKSLATIANQRLFFEDGNSVDISATKKDQILQLHLGNASQEIQRLLIKHADEIKIMLQDRLQVEVDLQFDANEGSKEFELAKGDTFNAESSKKQGTGKTEDLKPLINKQNRIKYLGFNQNEWVG